MNDIVVALIFSPIAMVVTAAFGSALMLLLWMRRVTVSQVPSMHRAYLLAAIGCLFGVGDGLIRTGVNPAGLSIYLSWVAFVPMSVTLIYFLTMSINKFAYAVHKNRLTLLRNALRIVNLAKVVAIAGFAYVISAELSDWTSTGFDGFVVIVALVGFIVSYVVLDMMYLDDWNECAMVELEGGSG